MGSKSRGWARKLGLVSMGALAVVLVAYLALVLIFRSLVDPASLADRAEPHVSSALNRRVAINTANVSIFPRPEVRLMRLRVENLADFEGVPLATIDELHLRPRLLPLLRKRVEIDRIRVVGPRLLLQVDEAGRTNFGDFVPASRDAPSAAGAPLSLDIRGIELVDGRLGYRNATNGRSLQADGLSVSGSVRRDPDGRLALNLESDVDSVRFAYPPAWEKGLGGLRIEARVEAVAGPEMRWIEIAAGQATLNGLTVEVSGRADSLRQARRQLDLEISGDRVDLSRLISSLPDSLRRAVPVDVWGDLGVDLAVRGTVGPGVFPEIDGMVTVRGGGLSRSSGQPLIEALDADMRVSEGRAEVSGARASLPGGTIAGEGAMALDSTLAFSFSIDGQADAAELGEALTADRPDRPVASRGTVRWQVSGRGEMDRPEATRLDGTLGLDGLEFTGGELVRPVEIPTASVTLRGSEASWSDVPVVAAGDELRTSGSLRDLLGGLAAAPRRPALRAEVTGRRLDLDALLGPAQAEIGYGRIAWARLADRLLMGRTPEDWASARDLRRPEPMPITGRIDVRVDSVVRLPYRVDRVEGVVVLHEEGIELADARFRAYGGTGTARGVLSLGGESAEPFRLEVALEDVRAEQYLAQNSPLGDLVSGSLTMDLVLEGGLDAFALPVTSALDGAGRFEIRDGRIGSNPLTRGLLSFLRLEGIDELRFDRWTSPFLVREGLIVLDGSDFSGSELIAELQGALGFGGSLDLGALVRPDSTLAVAATAAAGAAGSVIDRYLRAGGAVELALRLTGHASDPRVELDPDAMQESSRSVVDEAAQRARESGEEAVRERGIELLRGLVGGDDPDTAGVVSEDSASGGR